jgi:hypothetical protein
MSFISEKDKAALLAEVLDPNKVTLTCGTHHYAYSTGGKLKPNFKCKKCLFVMYMGLLANTPPDKRQDQMEMLEETVHGLVEAKQSGKLAEFFKHPEVYVNDKRIGVSKDVN